MVAVLLLRSLLAAAFLWRRAGADEGAADPTCAATLDLRSQEFWLSVATAAGVNLQISSTQQKPLPLNSQSRNTTWMRERMIQDGYLHLNDWAADNVQPLMKDFVAVIEEINNVRQLPATFLMMYDEPWQVAHALTAYLEPVYGLKLSHDFYVFNVKPGAQGWDIHRDGEGHDNILSFQKSEEFRDLPTYTTTWLALTDASEATSCMFFIPAHADEDYAMLDHPTGVDDEAFFAHDNDEKFGSILVDSHRYLHSAPVDSGNALVWSHRTLHWSSMSPPDAPHARFSMAFSMSKMDVDPPALKHTDLSVPPPFEARLALICYTGVSYHYNFHSYLKDKILHLLLDVLADDKYAQHLTDEAISPVHFRQLAGQFSNYLYKIYEDETLEGVQDKVEKVAHYIVKQRGLRSTQFLRSLADKVEDKLKGAKTE